MYYSFIIHVRFNLYSLAIVIVKVFYICMKTGLLDILKFRKNKFGNNKVVK